MQKAITGEKMTAENIIQIYGKQRRELWKAPE